VTRRVQRRQWSRSGRDGIVPLMLQTKVTKRLGIDVTIRLGIDADYLSFAAIYFAARPCTLSQHFLSGRSHACSGCCSCMSLS
jgi:hypothetical protein